MMTMRTFELKVYRDGRWWMIEIPEIDGLTQARRLGEVEDMARSFIAVDQDLAPSEIELKNPQVLVAGNDLASTMKEILDLRITARKLEEQVAALMVETARKLAKAEVPLRDIGTALEVSHQRVHQLLHGDVPSGSIPRSEGQKGKAAAAKDGRPVTALPSSGRSAATRATVKKAAAAAAAAAARSPKPGRHVKS